MTRLLRPKPQVHGLRFAYADPPYLGNGLLYKDHPEWRDCNTIEWHSALIQRLIQEYPDGFALSLGSNNLTQILPLIPVKAHICAWVKPFAIFKPNVNPGYTWEPVILVGGRKKTRQEPTIKDHLIENITLRKGLTGVKPDRFNAWICDLLGYRPGVDTLDDLFPGKGGMSAFLRGSQTI